MGIDKVGLHAICKSLQYVTSKNSVCTLGRQGLHISAGEIQGICQQYGLDNISQCAGYSECLFQRLGFENVDSMDASTYENATIIHDLNKPMKDSKQFSYILDGGTIEHVFNIPQCLQTVINSLELGGLFVSITCNNNFSGHGMYQFSPECFLSAFSKTYGMEILEMYISRVDSPPEQWVNVNQRNKARTEDRILTNEPVYIVTIAKKISDSGVSLLEECPQQFSYETGDWKNTL
jgi:hypothetical protein